VQRRSLAAIAVLCSVALAGCKGQSSGKSQGPAPGASDAEAAAAPTPTGFPAFSADAPDSARRGALGVRWVLFEAGRGDVPGPADQILASITVKKRDGSAGSQRESPQSLSFSADTLAEPLRDSVSGLRAGAKARYWVPKGALGRQRPSDWADEDLVLDLDVTKIEVARPVETPLSGKAPDSLVPKPDVTPPPDAKKSRKGYPYLRLVAGKGGVEPRADARVTLRFSAWRVDGLIATPLALDQSSSLQLAQAPGVVNDLVSRMVEGDVVRAWVPGAAAKGLVSQDVQALVVDLGLAKIE
jgi:hypothetical protein